MKKLLLLLPLVFEVLPFYALAMEEVSGESCDDETSNEEQPNLLAAWCQKGAAHSVNGLTLDHNIKNKFQIRNFVKDHSGGTLLILGPGPGNDLPIDELVDKFDRIIMADGYTQPMQEWLDRLPEEASCVKAKVEIKDMDLSGGFYAFFAKHRGLVKQALADDFLQYKIENRPLLTNYRALLGSANLSVNLAQFKADVLVSSIVTSQIGALTAAMVAELIGEIVKELQEQATLTGMNYDSRPLVKDLGKFGSFVRRVQMQHVRDVYHKAIRESSAKHIYYSNDYSDESRASDNFDNQLADIYQVIGCEKGAWHYGYANVSWYQFKLMLEKCGNCSREIAKKNRCGACQKVYYCNTDCQKCHWPDHKKDCVKGKQNSQTAGRRSKNRRLQNNDLNRLKDK